MMNGEVPGVPITTLSGIASLTDLLAELPLPSPLPSMLNRSLFSNPEMAEEAQRLIGRQDENLIPQLLQALSQTSTDHIELKDKSLDGELDNNVPPLLQAILARDPNVFRQRRGDGRSNSPRQPMAPSPYYQQHRSHLNVHSNSSSPSVGASSPGRYPQGSPARAPQGSPHPTHRAGGIPSHGSPVPVNGIPNMQGSASPSVPPQGAHIPSSPRAAATTVSANSNDVHTRAQATVHTPSTSTGKRGRPKKKHQVDQSEGMRTDSDSQKQSPVEVGAAGDASESGKAERHSKKRKKSKHNKEDREKDSDKSNVKYVISSPSHSTKITIKLRRPPEEDKSKSDQNETPEPRKTRGKGDGSGAGKDEAGPPIPAIKIKLGAEKSPEKGPQHATQKLPESATSKTAENTAGKEPTQPTNRQSPRHTAQQPSKQAVQQPLKQTALQPVKQSLQEPSKQTTQQPSKQTAQQPPKPSQKPSKSVPAQASKPVTSQAVVNSVQAKPASQAVTNSAQGQMPPPVVTVSDKTSPRASRQNSQPAVNSEHQEKGLNEKQKGSEVTLEKNTTVPQKPPEIQTEKVVQEVKSTPELTSAATSAEHLGAKESESVPMEVDVTPSKDKEEALVSPKTNENNTFKDGETPITISDTERSLLVTSPRVVLNKMKLPEEQSAEALDDSVAGRKRKRVNYKESESSMSPKEQPERFVDYGLDESDAEAVDDDEAGTPPPPPPIFIDRVEDADEDAKQEPKKKRARIEEEIETVTLDEEDIEDSARFRRFNAALESVFESSEAMDVSVDDTDDDNEECSPDLLITKNLLRDLVTEAAKLKSMRVMHQLPKDKLVHLLNILERNIRDGTRLQPHNCKSESKRDQRNWRDQAMSRITHSVDSALTATYIMTSGNMPKEVFIEDVIDRIAQLIKYQLQYSIYPEFDPVYRINRDAKGEDVIITNMKLKRSRGGATKERATLSLYNKLCELVSNMAELMTVQTLTDSTVLLVSSLGTAPFFVENVSELQLNALKLISTVFSQYEKHRQLILEDIFASLARLPSSKKNLRNFKLNTKTSIQMVTALVLQLIQCVVVLPPSDGQDDEKKKPEDEYDDIDSDEEENVKQEPPVDKGVLVVNAYETAIRTGQNFLSVFLKKCVSKDEEDYRPLFENFVQDLLSAVNKPEWPAAELLLSLLGRLLMHHFSNKSNDMTMRVSSLEYLGQIASRLRKDAVSSRMNQDVLDTISQEMISGGGKETTPKTKSPKGKNKKKEPENTDYLLSLQRAMLDYFSYNSADDPALMFARQFYVAQWYRDTSAEIENTIKKKVKEKEGDDERAEDADGEDEEDEESEEEEEESEEEEEDSSEDDAPRRGRSRRSSAASKTPKKKKVPTATLR